MDPIDASPTWRWHGYRNSWVDLDGVRMQSVSGGGHWGGGLWISSRDHARFGYLFLRRGRWKDQQLISERWIDLMTRPTDSKPTYGYLWWLNTGSENPGVPANSFSAVGAGTNMVWIDPAHDLVVVVRWIDPAHDQEFLKLVVNSVVSE
jgi:CubicO group peptidase (beta-lactamase class C family)